MTTALAIIAITGWIAALWAWRELRKAKADRDDWKSFGRQNWERAEHAMIALDDLVDDTPARGTDGRFVKRGK